jgi:hypothetical protein
MHVLAIGKYPPESKQFVQIHIHTIMMSALHNAHGISFENTIPVNLSICISAI